MILTKAGHRAGISETRGNRGKARGAKNSHRYTVTSADYLNNKLTAGGEGGAKAESSKNF